MRQRLEQVHSSEKRRPPKALWLRFLRVSDGAGFRFMFETLLAGPL
jgi:hypothetical protein